LLVLGTLGCATMNAVEEKVLAAEPAPDAGFLARPERLASGFERAPFDRIWTSRTRDWRSFSKLYVAPVDTDHVLEENLWEKLNLRQGEVKLDVPRLAGELRERFVDAILGDPVSHFEVVEQPGEIDADTAILELALVELVPNKAVLGAIGLAAWGAPLEIGIPVATATAFLAHGSIAVEARVRAADSGMVVAMFADRETGKMRIVDLRSLTWYGNAYEAMDDWASAFVELANTPRERKVRGAPLFTFMPW
jgi:hypothetical protein